MPFAENLGTGGGSLDAQYGSSPTANTNAPLLLDPRTSGNFVYTPGTAGNYVAVPHSPSLNILGTEGTPFLSLPGPGVGGQYASTPDTAALDITGDIDLRCRAQLTPTVPVTASANLITKGFGSGNYSYFYGVTTANRLFFEWSSNGSATTTVQSTTTLAVPSGVPYWYRATFDADNGAGGNDVSFYVSSDGITWTQVGTTVTTAGVATIFSSNSFLQLGGYGGSCFTDGRIYRAQVLNGINGTVVFDADFTQQALGSRGFIESTGKLVSLVGNAAQIVDGTTYGFLPGVVGSYWSAPDSAALSITGDIDIRARISLNDWTPAADTMIVAKLASTGNQRSYALRLTTGGTFYFTTSPDGITGVNTLANAANTLTNGQTYWIRGSLDVDDGAGNRVADFYYAPDSETEPTVWTQIGTTVTVAGATSIFDGTAALEIGSFNGGQSPAAGRVYRAIIRGNLTSGTKAFDADFTRQLQFASTFTEGSANLATVTTLGAARIERDRDLDLRVKVAMDDWTPASLTILAAKWNTTTNQRSFYFGVEASGELRLSIDSVGTSAGQVNAISTVPTGIANGSVKWVRVTLDVNNGSGGHVYTFFLSDDGITWTQLGATVSATGAVSPFNGTALVELGSINDGTAAIAASRFYAAQMLNGIDGPAVLDIDFTDAITTGAETYLPDTVTEVIPEALQYLPNLGWGGRALNARFGSAVGADTNDPLLLTHTGTNYLYLPGVVGNAADTPDAAHFTPSSSLSVRCAVALDSYRPGSDNEMVAHWLVSGNQFSWLTRVLTTGVMQMRFSTDGSTSISIDSTVAVPFSAGQLVALRYDWTASPAEVTFYAKVITEATAITEMTSNTGWSQVGEVRTASVPSVALHNSTDLVRIGRHGGTSLAAGKFYGAQVIVDGTEQLRANFTTGITSGAQTTFTESSPNAATVTINRSTSGRKSVAVVQDVLLFGADDYLEVPDENLLDFGASASFTVMSAVRSWNTPAIAGRLLDKFQGATGWVMSHTTSNTNELFISGTGTGQAISGTFTNGALTTATTVRNVSSDNLIAYVGAVAGVAGADNTTTTLANGNPLAIGRQNGGGNYEDMEFRGSAIWRRALTSTEVALVNTHYTTGPTAASTALMQQAVWWVDAGTRSVAQINRLTSGRKSVACARCTWLLATDDFFEVPASDLFNFDQGEDFTLLVVNRAWLSQGLDRVLMATQSSATASGPGWALSSAAALSTEQSNLRNHGKAGDGSNGVTAIAPAKYNGQLSATWLVRNTLTDTFTAYQGSAAGTPVTDVTTGTIGNTNVMRIGRFSSTGTSYLTGEIVAAVVWRRALTTAERNAVLAYYGV